MRVLHIKVWGANCGANNIMLLIQMEEEWTPIEFKTWDSNTISGCLEAMVGRKQVHLGTFSHIKDKGF